jgi:hypothetical protein
MAVSGIDEGTGDLHGVEDRRVCDHQRRHVEVAAADVRGDAEDAHEGSQGDLYAFARREEADLALGVESDQVPVIVLVVERVLVGEGAFAMTGGVLTP